MIGGINKSIDRAAIEPASLKPVRQDATLLGLSLERVGDLDLAVLPRGGVSQHVENIRRQDIAADDAQVRRSFLFRRLLDHVGDADHAILQRLARDHPVLVYRASRDLLDRHDRTAELLEQLHHLGQDTVPVGDTQVVGQHHRERLVTNQGLAGQDRVPEAPHLFLTGVGELAGLDQVPGGPDQVLLAGPTDLILQLVVGVEVVLDRPLAAAGHEPHPGQPRVDGLTDRVLDQWLVDDREHFLG